MHGENLKLDRIQFGSRTDVYKQKINCNRDIF